MKTQELLNRVRNEAQHVWDNLADQYHHLEQINNPAFVEYKQTEEFSAGMANGKHEAHWGLLPYDCFEMDNQLMVSIEIPGMEASDINITIEGNELVISGEKRKPTQREDTAQELTGEIAYGEFERRITLTGHRLQKTGHDASYEQGILTICLPYDGEGRNDSVRRITVQ